MKPSCIVLLSLCASLSVVSSACAEDSSLKMSLSLDAVPATVNSSLLAPPPAPQLVQAPGQTPNDRTGGRNWHVTKGKTIKEVLTQWAGEAHWSIEIDPEVKDERLGTSDDFSGTLYDGVRGLMGSIPQESPIGVNLWQGSEVMHVYVR